MSGFGLTTKGLVEETVRGFGLSTKGLIPQGHSPAPPAPPTPTPPPAAQVTKYPVVIVVPTAPNVLLMVAQNIAANLRASQAANLVLPSLYKRAYLMANETDEIAVVMP
jgi:hypothetical protein